ncbi:endonuclease/exonuclease/phosphatase (EEP) superfamily protein YafD [Catalinimonas alkaloidigena]|uniref:endonuclease/exonuclease/phosphatase family protein n=1 Tax=Catalinimonas alkaloidigena TaxID=1075417 RepID=UPI0024051B48|nr:endonuclease/exonuclease/phosphatase family protein [Catalinimonas alkaloidigena]MDF9800887.1 endonuclease/exonuclease/phosphatase (EEP) superfamily protein YafD [Catalinimonas alkaloidigena]
MQLSHSDYFRGAKGKIFSGQEKQEAFLEINPIQALLVFKKSFRFFNYNYLAMEIVSTVLTGLIIFFSAGAFLSYINKPYWFVRVFDFPLLSNSILLLLLSASYIFLAENAFQGWRLAMIIGAMIALIAAAFKLYRYFPFVAKSTLPPLKNDPKRELSILNANVRQKNRKPERLQSLIEEIQPDIIIMHETNHRWNEQMAYLKADYPYHILVPQENTYGMLLYARLRIEEKEVANLCDEGVPSIHIQLQLRNGENVNLHAIHPKPPEIGSHTHDRDTEIVYVGKLIGENDAPSIMAGDLNDVPWSKALILFRNLSNMLDPRRGRGFYNTFNAKFPLFRYPLDFINFTGHFRLVEMRRERHIHSDHFPLYVRLSYEPDSYYENLYNLVEAERQDAREIIDQKTRSVFPKPGLPHIDEMER